MSFTETEIRSAGRAIALGDEQVEGLLAVLRARPSAIGAAPAAPRAYERVRFDLVHLLWYTGALIVMGAMGLFSTLAFEQMGGRALTITALIYAALFTAGGHYLWHRRSLPTPGGLMITVAIGMLPLAVFGIQDTFGWWGNAGSPGHYQGFYVWVKSGWLPMEIVTIFGVPRGAAVLSIPFHRGRDGAGALVHVDGPRPVDHAWARHVMVGELDGAARRFDGVRTGDDGSRLVRRCQTPQPRRISGSGCIWSALWRSGAA